MKTTAKRSNQVEGRAVRLRRVFSFNNIDVASLIQPLRLRGHLESKWSLGDPGSNVYLLIQTKPKSSLVQQSLFEQISADSSPGLIILLSCSYQMKAMLPRATISGDHSLTCSRASNLRAPATGTSQRAPTTLFCFLRWPGRLDLNPRSTGLPARAWAGSQVATTAATTTSTGAASTWWTSTPSGTGWSAWCAAARWPPWNWAPSRGTSARSIRTPCCGARPTKKSSARCGRVTWAWRGGTSRTARRHLRLRKRRSKWSRSNRPPVRSQGLYSRLCAKWERWRCMLGSRGRGRRDDGSEVEKGKGFRSTQAALWVSFGSVTAAAPWSRIPQVLRSSSFRCACGRHYSWGGAIGTPTATHVLSCLRLHCCLSSFWSQVKRNTRRPFFLCRSSWKHEALPVVRCFVNADRNRSRKRNNLWFSILVQCVFGPYQHDVKTP